MHGRSGVALLQCWSWAHYWAASVHCYMDASMQPLTGYHFRIIPSANTSLAVNTLTGITVRRSTDAWAWGMCNVAPDNLDSNPITQLLVAHWDGQHWRIVPTP